MEKNDFFASINHKMATRTLKIDDSQRNPRLTHLPRDVVDIVILELGIEVKFVCGKFAGFRAIGYIGNSFATADILAQRKEYIKTHYDELLDFVNNVIVPQERELLTKYYGK